MAKAKTPTKATGKAMVPWDEELAKFANETSKGLKDFNGKFISFKSGRMTFGGEAIPGDELRCVIVGWAFHNAYYDPAVKFDASNPQSPICYATGTDEETMAPHAEAPQKQHAGCFGCPFNEFESATEGKGKACKNTIRLAIVAEDDAETPEKLAEAEVVYASIPPKSLKGFNTYMAKTLRDKLKRPHWSVITKIKLVPDPHAQFLVQLSMEQLVEDQDMFQPLKDKWEESLEKIDFPYPKFEAKPKKSAKEAASGKKFARK